MSKPSDLFETWCQTKGIIRPQATPVSEESRLWASLEVDIYDIPLLREAFNAGYLSATLAGGVDVTPDTPFNPLTMSKPSSFFSRLIGSDQSPESPSKYDCLAKGIARSWIEGTGWEIERSEAKAKEEGASSWTGDIRPMWKRDCHDVSLINRELDVVMTLEESAGNDYHSLSRLSVTVHDTLTIYDYGHWNHSPDPDAQYLLKVIRDNPYPALKPIVEAYEAKQARMNPPRRKQRGIAGQGRNAPIRAGRIPPRGKPRGIIAPRLKREEEINKAASDKAIEAIEKLGCPS